MTGCCGAAERACSAAARAGTRCPRDSSSSPSAKSPGHEVGFKASPARRSSSPLDLECAECDRRVGEFLPAELERFAKALFCFGGILQRKVGQAGLVKGLVIGGSFRDGRLEILVDIEFFPAGGEKIARVLRDRQVARRDGRRRGKLLGRGMRSFESYRKTALGTEAEIDAKF